MFGSARAHRNSLKHAASRVFKYCFVTVDGCRLAMYVILRWWDEEEGFILCSTGERRGSAVISLPPFSLLLPHLLPIFLPCHALVL